MRAVGLAGVVEPRADEAVAGRHGARALAIARRVGRARPLDAARGGAGADVNAGGGGIASVGAAASRPATAGRERPASRGDHVRLPHDTAARRQGGSRRRPGRGRRHIDATGSGCDSRCLGASSRPRGRRHRGLTGFCNEGAALRKSRLAPQAKPPSESPVLPRCAEPLKRCDGAFMWLLRP